MTEWGLWDYDDVAAYLRCSPLTVRRWANERRLPVVKVGALNRFRPADIEAWAEARVQPVEGDHEGDPT